MTTWTSGACAATLIAAASIVPMAAQAQSLAPTTSAFQLSLSTSGTLRTVAVDAAPFLGPTGIENVTYDLDAVLRPTSVSGLRNLPDWAVAVRLVLSEAGADRLVANRYGMLEAMGIIETVFHRMDAEFYNPNGIRGAGAFPGCTGTGATFASCANPQQYYGVSRDRALNPAAVYGRREMLLEAIDISVAAWWMLDTHMVENITNGATSFRHACGGEQYGAPSTQCGSTITGPIVFSGPTSWNRSEGRYTMSQTRRVDYRPGTNDVEPGYYARYLGRPVGEPTYADLRTSPADDAAVLSPRDTADPVERGPMP